MNRTALAVRLLFSVYVVAATAILLTVLFAPTPLLCAAAQPDRPSIGLPTRVYLAGWIDANGRVHQFPPNAAPGGLPVVTMP